MGREAINKQTGLTNRQERFARLYVRNGGNASKAYKDAEYSANTSVSKNACRLLKKSVIAEYIKAYEREYALEQDSSVEGILEKLKYLWTQTTEAREWHNALKVVELEGKYHKMWSDKVVIETEVPAIVKEEDVPELMQTAKRMGKILAMGSNKA